jgi:hypothetical protein
MAPLLVLRVGYMERYDGPDQITGGGGYVTRNGVGGEVYNFKPSRGYCYGFAMSRHFSGINLSFFEREEEWNVGDELNGVDVVFIAKRPGVGQVVIGWYRNATVFHKLYAVRRGRIEGMDALERPYLCFCDVQNVHLLPEDDRSFSVPSAPAGNKGFPGQSNVWYPANNLEFPDVAAFVPRLRKYISHMSGNVEISDDEDTDTGKIRRTRKPNHAHNAEVELKAVEAVSKKYRNAGYTITSVESDNCGWDLIAEKGGERLHLEVKGASGADIYFELTPNEYKKLKEHAVRYRVCVVCRALTEPVVYDFIPKRISKKNVWKLTTIDQAIHVILSERIAAIGTEIGFG